MVISRRERAYTRYPTFTNSLLLYDQSSIDSSERHSFQESPDKRDSDSPVIRSFSNSFECKWNFICRTVHVLVLHSLSSFLSFSLSFPFSASPSLFI